MALDTTIGGTSANSYISLAEWQAYWAARGVDLSQHGHDSSHEANLIQAADWMDREWLYVGYKQYQYQGRAWPRLTSAYVDGWPILPDTIPQAIKDAQAELAYLIHEGLKPWETQTGVIKREKSKSGPVESEVEYLGGLSEPRIVAIRGLLGPYITSGSGMVRLRRG